MNRELLHRVADHIDAFPESFDLSWWAQATALSDCKQENICDTFGCVAGWTVMIANPVIRAQVATGEIDQDDFRFSYEAARLLELDESSADTLFTNNRWWATHMKVFNFEPSGEYDRWDGSWVPLECVPPKAASTILRALANDEINLDGDWGDDDY